MMEGEGRPTLVLGALPFCPPASPPASLCSPPGLLAGWLEGGVGMPAGPGFGRLVGGLGMPTCGGPPLGRPVVGAWGALGEAQP